MKHSFPKRLTALLLMAMMIVAMVPLFVMGASAAEGETYELVTDASTLKAGDKLLIVCPGKSMVMGAQNGTYRDGVSANITEDKMTVPEGAQIITLGGSEGAWTLGVSETEYLTYSGTKNTLTTGTTADTWTIAIAADGSATILHGTETTRKLQWNASSPRFACYTSTQTAISLYRLAHEHSYAWNNTAGADGSHTLVCANTDGKCDALTTTEDCTWVSGACSVCGAAAPECAHLTTKNVDAVPATCTTGGYTAGVQCTVCDQFISGHEEIASDPNAHTSVTDAAVDPTCTVTGLTEGSHCSVCNNVLMEQNTIDMIDHNYVDGKCSACGDIFVNGTQLAEFQFGANGNASHKDGTGIDTGVIGTSGAYELNFTSFANVYGGAYDAQGNSALKLGTSSKAASFTFEVPANVNTVVLYIAGYKVNAAKVSVNNTEYTIESKSDEGAYTKIVVDTTTNKTVTLETLSGGYRAMVNSIEFWGDAPSLDSFGLTLNKGVTVKVTYNIPEAWLTANPNAKVVFSNGTELEATPGTNIYSVTLTPAQINTALTVQLGDMEAQDVSFAAYKNKILLDNTPATLGISDKKCEVLYSLLEMIEGYGRIANEEYKDSLMYDVDIFEDKDVMAPVTDGNNTEIFQSMSAVLGKYASLRVNIATESEHTLKVTLNDKLLCENKPLAVTDKSIVIEGLYPLNFNDTIIITIDTATAEASFNFNYYLKALYESTEDIATKNLAAVTYLYGVYAEAFAAPETTAAE